MSLDTTVDVMEIALGLLIIGAFLALYSIFKEKNDDTIN